MNSKKIKVIIIVLIIFILIGIALGLYLKYKNNNYIPNDYIAVFNGGSGEITYSTYIYKIDNGQANYGFKYINTTNVTVSGGSSEWEIKITGRGKVTWTDQVFKVAKNNGAYSYVRLHNDSRSYSIEEFEKMFMMN